MQGSSRLTISALVIAVCAAAAATHAQQRPPQGVASGVEKPLRIAPGPNNGRNSEGDFIQLKDGRLLLIYSKFSGTGDHAPAELAGRYSSDGGKTWDIDDVPIISRKDDDANLMSVSLLRLADGRIALFYIRKQNSPPGSKYPYLDHILMRTSNDEGNAWSEPIHVVSSDQPGYRVLNNDRVIQLKGGRLVVPLAVHYLPGWPGFQSSADIVCHLSDDQHVQNIGTDPQGWYCYTAIEFVGNHVLLAHCEYPGLNSLQITRLPLNRLYESTNAADDK